MKTKIKLILSDIDGTITDGCMYYNEVGYAFKRFEPHINSGLHMLEKAKIPIEFFTSGRKGFAISQQFARAFGVPCELVFPIEKRAEFLEKKYNEYKDEPGYFVYLGDSDWDVYVIKKVFGQVVHHLQYDTMDNLLIICPQNSTKAMKSISRVSNINAGEGFFYNTIYNLLKET